MSVYISGPAWKTTFTNPTDKLVLLSIADQATDSGDCWGDSTRLDRLQERTGFGKDAVMDSLERLRTWQILEVVRCVPGRPTQHKVIISKLGEGCVYDHRALKNAGGLKPPAELVGENHPSSGSKPPDRVGENHPSSGSKPPAINKDLPSSNDRERQPVSAGGPTIDELAEEVFEVLLEIPAVGRSNLADRAMQIRSVRSMIEAKGYPRFDASWWRDWAMFLAADLPVRLRKKYGQESVYACGAASVLMSEWSRRPKMEDRDSLGAPVPEGVEVSSVEALLIQLMERWAANGIAYCAWDRGARAVSYASAICEAFPPETKVADMIEVLRRELPKLVEGCQKLPSAYSLREGIRASLRLNQVAAAVVDDDSDWRRAEHEEARARFEELTRARLERFGNQGAVA